jgi:UPF0755 protein
MSERFTQGWSKGRLLAIGCLVLLLLTSSVFGYCEYAAHKRPQGNPDLIELEIERGISMVALIDRLEMKGLISNRLVAKVVLRREDVFGSLKAGAYRFNGDSHLVDVAEILKAGPNALPGRRFTIRPGESLYEVAVVAESLNLSSTKVFLAAVQSFPFAKELSRHLLSQERPDRPDGEPWMYLEGILGADTYFLDEDTSLQEFLETAATRFHAIWTQARTKRTDGNQIRHSQMALGDYELLILASLVEEETRVASEARRIAGVFLNRLAKHMKLKSDPTAMYRSDRVGKQPVPMDTRDTSNPFNTYAHKGLPPGPICAPGPAAIAAAFSPEEHEFLFFVARRDGSGLHVFAKTGKEHMLNVNKHLRGK